MPVSDSLVTLLITLLLFTSFVKIVTALSVFRYGAGLTGFEFGVVSLLASFCLAVVAAPPELAKIGFPGIFFGDKAKPNVEEVSQALVPFMAARVDPQVSRVLSQARGNVGDTTAPSGQNNGDGISVAPELARIAPAFLISELKSALSVGLMLLIPFMLIDLVVAHLLTLVGIGHLSAGSVALPLKLVLFMAVDGWSLLVSKLLAS